MAVISSKGIVVSAPIDPGEPRTWAVVVMYRADPSLLREQYDALAGQVDGIVYVDNAAGRETLTRADITTSDTCLLVGDGDNVGLAAGLNLGIAEARRVGAPFVLLMDQDSVPSPAMVSTLHELRAAESERYPQFGAIGPAIYDELRGHTEYFARLRLPLNRHIRPGQAAGDPFEVDFLITSGTLVSTAVLDRVGPMDADLFIDSVDFDWSFRATAAGFTLLATFRTAMSHRRGDEIRRIGPLELRVHSGTRLFYMYRNRFWLYRRAYVPMAWKVHDFARMLVKGVLIAGFVPGRLGNIAAMCRGVAQGLR